MAILKILLPTLFEISSHNVDLVKASCARNTSSQLQHSMTKRVMATVSSYLLGLGIAEPRIQWEQS
jgi:hypothetical protein